MAVPRQERHDFGGHLEAACFPQVREAVGCITSFEQTSNSPDCTMLCDHPVEPAQVIADLALEADSSSDGLPLELELTSPPHETRGCSNRRASARAWW